RSKVVALISEYRKKRYRSVWFEEYGSEASKAESKQPLPNTNSRHNHANNNGAAASLLENLHLAAKEALQVSPDSCKTAAIPLELSRLESGGLRHSSRNPPAQSSRTSLLGKPIKSGRHRGPRYRKSQALVYNFLERPRGFKSVTYHVLLSIPFSSTTGFPEQRSLVSRQMPPTINCLD
ncbi:uncharacterized protein LOC118202175, partial [Stegodyphus dumicola]|uniref:uncharacterized protein LOC118202175 n=1 Tax=Stegodyphus dumicola TaxID=202533 RepID=UPI0015B24A8E